MVGGNAVQSPPIHALAIIDGGIHWNNVVVYTPKVDGYDTDETEFDPAAFKMSDACVVQESYGHTLGYGLTMVAALSELAPVLHVKTFQQERGDSSCGIWATWNKTMLDWYIELEVHYTARHPEPASSARRSHAACIPDPRAWQFAQQR